MPRKKQKWEAGDVFVLTLDDKTNTVGQVLREAGRPLNSAICAFTNIRLNGDEAEIPFSRGDVIAVLFATPDQLESGDRKVVRHESEYAPVSRYIDMAALEAKDFRRVTVIGSGNVHSLLNAWHGLEPWDAFYEPDYLDKLLLPFVMRPASAVLSKDQVENSDPKQ